MAGISLRFRALSNRRLALVSDEVIRQSEQYVREWLAQLQQTVQPYPPAPSSSTYKRTFRLFNSWATTVSVSGTRIQGTISVRAPYASFVQGREQIAIHRQTGWKRLIDYEDRVKYRQGLQKIYDKLRIAPVR